MKRHEHLELLATLAEVAPHLGLDPADLRRQATEEAEADFIESHPYTYSIWRHHVEYTNREMSLGDAIDMWMALEQSDECAMGKGGIFFQGTEIVTKQQLEAWSFAEERFRVSRLALPSILDTIGDEPAPPPTPSPPQQSGPP